MSIVRELKRRNVFKVAAAYAAVGWLLIEITATTFPILKLPDWSVTLVTVLLLIGFPLALIFAWAFEITPDGIVLEKHVDRSQSITHITGRKIDYIIIATLILVLAFFVVDKFVFDPSRDAQLVESTTRTVTERAAEDLRAGSAANAIAVLPFVDLSPEGDQAYFSEGISEEILNALAHVPGLHVISRSSAFSFKGRNVPISTVAEKLGIASVIEGSVRKSGNLLRITAQLIDARADRHLWSATYDREMEDIFKVQDEISLAVVTALRKHAGLQLKEAPRVTATTSLEAHDAYLRGRYLMHQRYVEGAVRELEKAMALDPDYALAHAELAMATLLLLHYSDLTETEAEARAKPHAERAMALDPTLAEASAAAGYLLWSRWDLHGAASHFRQAIQINPNYASAFTWLGTVYLQLGRYKEGFAMQEAAARLDPRFPVAIWNYSFGLIARNRLAEADRELENFVSIAPPANQAYARGFRAALGGNWSNEILGNMDGLLINPEAKPARRGLSQLFAVVGLEKEALAISARPPHFVMSWLGRPGDAVTTAQAYLAEDPESFTARHELGLALAGAGDYLRARPLLEDIWQQNYERVTTGDQFGVYGAAALFASRSSAGEEDAASELVTAIRDNVRRYREAGMTKTLNFGSPDYEEGLAAYLAGAHEKGLALIARAVEDGYFIPPSEAYLQALYDDPGFAPILAMQEARQTRERDKFLDIVCSDNPYAAFWQPAVGTCKQITATGKD